MEKAKIKELVDMASKEMDICGFMPDPTGARLLEAARDYLSCLQELSNTQMHMDTNPDCDQCDYDRTANYQNFCGDCGKDLRQ